MASPHLMADHFFDVIDAPADLGEERVPGPKAQIDTEFQHRSRVGRHERRDAMLDADVVAFANQSADFRTQDAVDHFG